MRMVALLLVVAAAGCLPTITTTVEELKEKPAARVSFEVNRPYQLVYRTIFSQARKCYESLAGPYLQRIVHGDLYTDLKTGNVTVTSKGGAYDIAFLGVEITALSDEVTRIDAYAGRDLGEFGTVQARAIARARAVQAWVNDDARDCAAQPKT